MRIAIVANDTRGGVEPYAHLARGLSRAGHEVVAAAPSDYRPIFESASAFIPLEGANRADITSAPEGVGMIRMGSLIADRARTWARDAVRGAEGVDLVCAGIGGMVVAQPVAEALGVPLVRAHLQPLDAPSFRYPGPLAPKLSRFGGPGNRAAHVATTAVITTAFLPPLLAARKELGLPRRGVPPHPSILYGFSEHVVPVRGDARTQRIATGYWVGPSRGVGEIAAEEVDPSLREFVERPGPVVSIGFGSMTGGNADALRQLVESAVRESGVRAVLITGWGAMGDAAPQTDSVLTVESAPHGWLFPRVAATVHHGGAGTTGAALLAGVPTVVVPFGADQMFWGTRAHELGVAPRPIPRRRLTADGLSAAIRTAVGSNDLIERASRLGARLRGEDGVATAIRSLEAIELRA